MPALHVILVIVSVRTRILELHNLVPICFEILDKNGIPSGIMEHGKTRDLFCGVRAIIVHNQAVGTAVALHVNKNLRPVVALREELVDTGGLDEDEALPRKAPSRHAHTLLSEVRLLEDWS